MSTPNEWRKSRHLPVLASRANLFYAREEVDVSNTAFNEGKEFRISREYSVGATPLVFRFESPVDFILQLQSLTCDVGNIRFRAYRSTQGSAGGAFDQVEPIYRVNSTETALNLDPMVSILYGGSFTPDAGQVSVETIRLRVSNATSGRATVSGGVGDERGLAAGTYYLMLARIDGNETAAGVFDLKWEEIRQDTSESTPLTASTALFPTTEMSNYGAN